MDIQEFAHFLCDGHVEIKEVFPVVIIERLQVVHVVIKEGAIAIGAHQSIPMQVAPVAMVTNADIRNKS